MADERLLEIVLRARDEASKVIDGIGDSVDNARKEAEKLSKSFAVAGGIVTGFGVAGAAVLKDWVDKASEAQVEAARFNTILEGVAEDMQMTTVVIKGNEGALKSQTDAINKQIEAKKLQIEKLRLSKGEHDAEIASIKESVNALKLEAIAISETTTVKDKSIQVINKNALGLDQLRKATEEVARSYIQLGFDDETTSTVFAKNLSVTKNLTDAKTMLALAADLARYKTIGLAEAGQALQLAMMGNTRVLKQLGIEVEDNMTKQQIMSAIESKVAGQAQGYSETYAGAMTRMKVVTDNLKESLGGPLLNTLTDVAIRISDFVQKLTEADPKMFDMIAKVTAFGTAFALVTGPLLILISQLPALGAGLALLSGPVGIILASVIALGAAAFLIITNWQQIQVMLQPVFEWLLLAWGVIKANLNEFVTSNLPLFQAAWDGFTKAIAYGMQATYALWSAVWPSMQTLFKGVWEVIKGVAQVAWGVVEAVITIGLAALSGNWSKAWEGMKTAFYDIGEGLKSIAKGIWDAITGIFKGGLNSIISQLNGFIGSINKARPGTIGFSIPSFDNGGWVGQDMLAMVHKGEFVMSRDMLSGQQVAPAFATTNHNASINVGPVYVQDSADIDTLVQRLGFYFQTAGNL